MTQIQMNIASPSTGKNTDFCRLVTLLKPCFNHHFFFFFLLFITTKMRVFISYLYLMLVLSSPHLSTPLQYFS